jgi:hypothetical protein
VCKSYSMDSLLLSKTTLAIKMVKIDTKIIILQA